MRLLPLDSLRGIAALSVVLHHCLLVFPSFEPVLFDRGLPITETRSWSAALLTLTPLGLLWSGREPVMLFFVLSGLVLALPFVSGRKPRYLPFATKRVIRLLAPSAVVVLLLALALPHVPTESRPDLSRWFALSWTEPVTLPLVLQHLVLVHDYYPLNNVLWTLDYELRASLVFPLLVLIAGLRLPIVAAIGFAAFTAGVVTTRLVGTDILGVLVFLPHFLLGILLARHWAAIVQRLGTFGVDRRIGLWVLCFLLLRVRWLVPLPGALCDLANGFGAALLIALVMSSAAAQAALSHRSLVWLGEISFSLYLVHVPLILGALHFAPPQAPPALVLAGVIPLSLLIATWMHRLVERPTIALGRRLAAWLEPDPKRRGATADWPPAHR
jgi:peptidoglycan/LPS O-acetylase OafA/YrhL